MPSDDVAPPSSISIQLEEVKRVRRRGSSCDDRGWVLITVEPYKEDWGYRTEVVDGTMPQGSVPSFPVETISENLQFTWGDEAEYSQRTIEATLQVTPVDKWGREGEPSEPLTVHDPGGKETGRSDAACNTSGSHPLSTSAMLALLPVLVRLRRKQSSCLSRSEDRCR